MTFPATPFQPEFDLIESLTICTGSLDFSIPNDRVSGLEKALAEYGDATGMLPLEIFEYRTERGDEESRVFISVSGMKLVTDQLAETIVDWMSD